ncbi:MAG: hypothetical protein H6Q67_1822 [Firmicutes bacterium]|nr:hypothetical protein [Bacillota bacterium]
MEDKKRGGAREGAGRKVGPEGIKKAHNLRFTDAAWDRIERNAKNEGYDTVTAFIEAKTAY